jgi:hypothetical protein
MVKINRITTSRMAKKLILKRILILQQNNLIKTRKNYTIMMMNQKRVRRMKKLPLIVTK